MKKIIAIVLSVVVAFGGFSMTAVAQTQSEHIGISYSESAEAKAVLNLLLETEIFPGETVTRAEFVTAVLDIMKVSLVTPSEYYFKDVPSILECAPYVYTAAELGYISKGEQFEPNRNIAPGEALKIVVRMLGYELLVNNKGGYPAGDFYVANKLDLVYDLDMSSNELSKDEAYILLLRGISAPQFEQVLWGSSEEFTAGGKTVLQSIYDIYIVEGIVNRTPYNTLDGNEFPVKQNVAEIDGIAYNTDSVSYNMLGVSARAYVKDENNSGKDTIVYASDLSEKITISLDDIDQKQGNKLTWWDEQSDKYRSYKLANNLRVILNGRKLSSGIDAAFSVGAGNVTLVDNDDDNIYDVAYVNRYDYSVSAGYDSVTQTYRDKYLNANTFAIDEKVTIILDESGNELDPLDIAQDEVYRVIKSADGGFVVLQRITAVLSGDVENIDFAENTMRISGNDYILSDYFKTNFANHIEPGDVNEFYIDGNIVASSAVNSSNTKYGYLLDAKWSGGLERQLEIRMFTQSGQFEVLGVREKLTLDGVKATTDASAYTTLIQGGSVTPQLIRYGVASDGKVNIIDLATSTAPDKAGVYEDKTNCLTEYSGWPADLRYNTHSGGMGAMYNVSGSVVFQIPSDISDEENFQIRGSDFFVHDNAYSFKVYDINESGTAGALIYQGSNAYSVHPDNPSMIVRRIVSALDSDGNSIYHVYGWISGGFTYVTLDSDFVVSKTSQTGTPVDSTHKILSGGDVITYALDSNNKIRALNVIYDGRQGAMKSNVTTMNDDVRRSPMYYEGIVYDVINNYAIISIAGTDFSAKNLRYIKINTTNIASYNAKNGNIRPLAASDIKTYKSDGDNAHHAVFCMSNMSNKTICCYENMEVRK